MITKKFYKNILSCSAADEIYHAFMEKLLTEGEQMLEITPYTANSFGFINLPATQLEKDNIDSIIRNDFGQGYLFTHTYARIYLDNAYLLPHIDKEGLDLTLTVNVHSDTANPWPIFYSENTVDLDTYMYPDGSITPVEEFQEFTGNSTSFITNKGDGVCSVKQVPHWRETFKASYLGEHFVQVFYHWKKI